MLEIRDAESPGVLPLVFFGGKLPWHIGLGMQAAHHQQCHPRGLDEAAQRAVRPGTAGQRRRVGGQIRGTAGCRVNAQTK